MSMASGTLAQNGVGPSPIQDITGHESFRALRGITNSVLKKHIRSRERGLWYGKPQEKHGLLLRDKTKGQWDIGWFIFLFSFFFSGKYGHFIGVGDWAHRWGIHRLCICSACGYIERRVRP